VHERWTVRWFRKRALLYHLLVLIIVPGCLIAADWQIHRAEQGNFLSFLYSLEWPVFALLATWGWWQLIHEDPARVESRKVERARRAAQKGPFVPPPPDADSGFLHPLQAASRPELTAETPRVYVDESGVSIELLRAADGTLVRADDGMPVAAEDSAVAEHSLSAYNAYLARLAVGRTRKSWRNPHGVPTKP
jgi:hypothetical protein